MRLNVDGETFLTTVPTLAERCLYFRVLSSEGAVPTLFLPDAQGGSFFIDRDPAPFCTLVAFCRTGTVPADLPANERRNLREEAAYYGCTALAEAAALREAPPVPVPAPKPAGPPPVDGDALFRQLRDIHTALTLTADSRFKTLCSRLQDIEDAVTYLEK